MGSPPPLSDLRRRLVPIGLAQGVGLVCGLVGVKVTSTYVPPDVLGRYALFLTLAQLAMLVFHAGLTKYVARHWAASAERRTLARAVARGARAKLPWFTLALMAGAVFVDRDGWPVLALLAWPAAVLMSWLTFAQTSLQALREHWADCGASTLGSLSRSFVPPLLFVLSGGYAYSLELGFILYAGLTGLTYHLLARRHLGPRGEDGSAGAGLPPLRTYDGSLFLGLALGQWVLLGIGRWTASGFFGDAFTGLFSLAANIALVPTTMLGTMVVQAVQPRLFARKWSSSVERKELARTLDRLAALTTFAGLGGLWGLQTLAPYLVGPWIAPRYAEALPWVLPAGCFSLALVLGQLFQLGLLASHQEAKCGPVDLPAMAALVVLLVVAASVGGLDGFRFTLLASPAVPWLWQRQGLRRFLFAEARQ